MKNKTMLWMLISVGLLFGIVFGFKAFKNYKISEFMKSRVSAEITVSSMKVGYASWQPQLSASGSTRAVLGVNVTTELSGMVKNIYFKPGDLVKKDDLLVQLNIEPELAQLELLKANAALAKITYERDKAQYAIRAISKATLDADEANLKSTKAQVAQQEAVIAQKTVRAPFSGRLGICNVYPGQYVTPGEKITMLQTLDPIYVDFYIPQQSLPLLMKDQFVAVSLENFPKKAFIGKISTIDPGVDPTVRNVQVEATIPNKDLILSPGMFVSVYVETGKPTSELTIPQNAVSFNPYGEIVYVIKEQGKTATGSPMLVANQRFVITGEKRGNQIVINKGLKEGEIIVTSGQLKLKNGSRIKIDNSIALTDNPNPTPVDE